MSVMYHEGNRRLQDKFDCRRISDRLEEKLTHSQFTEGDKDNRRGRGEPKRSVCYMARLMRISTIALEVSKEMKAALVEVQTNAATLLPKV
jgi:hypothetical protein